MRTFRSLVLGWVLAGALGGGAHAATLYGNFDPTLTAPPDYSTTSYADLSGYCNSAYCQWINVYTAGMTFTATASGPAGHAYLAFQQTYVYGGAEDIYGLTIIDSVGDIVARGGLYQHELASHTLPGTQILSFDLYPSISAGQSVANGTLAATAPDLVAGQSYTAIFAQTYGSMSYAHWLDTDIAAGGNASQYCATNVGGACAFLNGAGNGWDYVPSSAPLSLLPTLVVTDASGLSAVVSTPEPASALLLGLPALAMARLRRRTG